MKRDDNLSTLVKKMGTIFEKFGSQKYNKEAEVSQNFIIPLLNILGYSIDEIIPEEIYTVPGIRFNRKTTGTSKNIQQRPDFIVRIGNKDRFVVESKASTENLDRHEAQSLSYVSGVKVNIIVVTNGIAFRIYDANYLIFDAKNIEELDIKFELVKELLSRDIHINNKPIDIIRSYLNMSINVTKDQKVEDENYQRKLELSDFINYLRNVNKEFKDWQVPKESYISDYFDFKQYPPDELLKFQDHDPFDDSSLHTKEEIRYSFSKLEENVNTKTLVLIGQSGIGKTTFLKYLAWLKSKDCLDYLNTSIPVYIQLRNYGLNSSVYKLIIESFFNMGLNISDEQFREYLRKNKFIFLFDAFDEVQEKYINDLNKELKQFVEVGNHKLIITTRQLRVPRVSNSSFFYICPLETYQIQELAKKYFDHNWKQFYNEIQIKGLLNGFQSTLFIIFSILVYKKYNYIPSSRSKSIEKIIFSLKDWENEKEERYDFNLSWEIKSKLLEEIAFACAKHKSLSLTKEEANKNLLSIIEYYEASRDIPYRTEKRVLINNLISTGIISENAVGVSFWHTAFLEYFASKSLAEKYLENPTIIEEIKSRDSWKNIVIGAAGFLKDSTSYVESILETNLYLASNCLLESEYIDRNLINKIESKLASTCGSFIVEVRQRGIYFLSKIEEKYPSQLLFEIFDKTSYPDVKQKALEQFATIKSKRTKEIVYSLIDWEEESTFFGISTTQGSVAKALSNFEEKEHLLIIDIWKKNTDIFTSIACREAFIDIIRRGRLTEEVKEKLFDFYLGLPDQTLLSNNIIYFPHKKNDLARLIIEIGDIKFVPRLIQNLKNINNESEEYESIRGVEEILASFESNDVIEQLVSYAFDKDQPDILRGCCAGALSKSKGKVDISIIKHLFEDDNSLVRINVVNGFRKYPSSQIKEILFGYINDEDTWIRSQIIEILGEKGLLVELVKNDLFSFKCHNDNTASVCLDEYCCHCNSYSVGYYDVISTYLKQISKHYLYELLPTIDQLRYIINEKIQIEIAETYCSLFEDVKAKRIIENLYEEDKFVNGSVLPYIIKLAPKFDSNYSLQLIHRALKTAYNIEEKSIPMYENLCIETLKDIGTDDAIELLKKMAEKGELIKIIFESLNPLASVKEEDWYINFLKLNTHINYLDLYMVIKGLGKIGTKKSIKIIQEIAQFYKDNSYILDICFKSYENIMFSCGKITDVQEEDLF